MLGNALKLLGNTSFNVIKGLATRPLSTQASIGTAEGIFPFVSDETKAKDVSTEKVLSAFGKGILDQFVDTVGHIQNYWRADNMSIYERSARTLDEVFLAGLVQGAINITQKTDSDKTFAESAKKNGYTPFTLSGSLPVISNGSDKKLESEPPIKDKSNFVNTKVEPARHFETVNFTLAEIMDSFRGFPPMNYKPNESKKIEKSEKIEKIEEPKKIEETEKSDKLPSAITR